MVDKLTIVLKIISKFFGQPKKLNENDIHNIDILLEKENFYFFNLRSIKFQICLKKKPQYISNETIRQYLKK